MSSINTYPAGGTWFDTLKNSLVNVHPDPNNGDSIETTAFLDAAESSTTLFGMCTFFNLLRPPSSRTQRCFGLNGIHSGQK